MMVSPFPTDTISVLSPRYKAVIDACRVHCARLGCIKIANTKLVPKSLYLAFLEIYSAGQTSSLSLVELGQSLVDQFGSKAIIEWINLREHSIKQVVYFGNKTDHCHPFRVRVEDSYHIVEYTQNLVSISQNDLEYTAAVLCSLIRLHPDFKLQQVIWNHPTSLSCDRYQNFFGCRVVEGSEKVGQIEIVAKLGDNQGRGDFARRIKKENHARQCRSIISNLRERYFSDECCCGNNQSNFPSKWTVKPREVSDATPRKALKDARISLALAELRVGTPIKEIAAIVGYSDVTTFTRAFTSWMGKPPAQFRKQEHIN